MNASHALAEMMANWASLERQAKARFPDATNEEIYQIVSSAMNRSLNL